MFKINVFLSVLYYLATMIVGIFTYKYLWGNVSDHALKYWMILFEFSIVLMLMDFGFTQKFLKNNLYGDGSIKESLSDLRITLVIYGFILISILFFYIYFNGVYEYIDVFSLVLICLSFFFNFISYAETANLKYSNSLLRINFAQMGGLLFYVLIIFNLDLDFILNVSLAMFFRSLLLYLIQIKNFSIKFNYILRPDFDAVKLNFSYFMFFSIDLVVFEAIGLSLFSMVVLGLYLKYFNIIRGGVDVINNYVFLRLNNINYIGIYYALLVVGYLLLGFICNYILGLYFDDFKGVEYLPLLISINFLAIGIYRLKSNIIYYKNPKVNFTSIIIKVLAVKLVFFVSYMLLGDYFISYIIQFILITLLIYNILIVEKSSKNCGN